MVKNRIDILISADDKATAHIKRFENQTKKSSEVVKRSFTDIAVKAAAVVIAFRSVSRVAGAFIDAASKVQQLQVRLTVLTGTVQKGNELFEEMARLAGRVPFTYDEIMESAVNLRAVVREGNQEVVDMMPIILDLAATTGLSVQETTSQMIRMYSAGAGAADLFRERGVLAMLGFQAGVSYSTEETMDRVIAAWTDANSRFRGATDQLAGTWQGKVSMMEDAWFKFRSTVAEGFLETDAPNLLTTALNFWTEKIKEATGATEEYTPLLEDLNDKLNRVNEQIEANMEKQSAPFLLNRNEIEQQFNDLLVQRSRLLGTIHSINQTEVKEESEGDKARQEAEEIKKTEKEKAEVKKKTSKEILDTQVSNLETYLLKSSETNKAAAVAFKAIQTGRAIINTSEAITEALPNLPLAALVAAMGAAELATIASTGFSKGTDSVPSMLTPGEMVVPRDFASAIRSGDLTLGGRDGGSFGDINIFIQGGINPAGASVNEMAEQLGFAFEREIRTARSI